jgi:hypothetical protein
MRTVIAVVLLAAACQSRLEVGPGHGPNSGGYGSGGTGGSGGSPYPTGVFGTGGSPVSTSDAGDGPPAAPALLLDDMEDGTTDFESRGGISGNWQTGSSPASPLIAPLDVPRGASARGTHGVGAGLYDLTLTLHSSPRDPNAADLSAYEGVAFWARSSVGPDLVVAMADCAVTPFEDFWSSESHGKPWPARRLSLTPRWERYVLLFEDFAASIDAGPDRRLDLSAICGLHFLNVATAPVDFWIDDVVLLCRGPCPDR